MATKDITAEELVEVLKFTPRTYKITMWGYGGEKVMGSVDPEVWDYCMENSVDLTEIAWSDEDTVQNDMGLDIEKLPFYPGQWYECDGMAHTNGVSRDAGTLQIEDENGDTVFEKSLEDCDGCDDSPGWSCQDEVWVGMDKKKGDVVFVGTSNEKGTFFEGEIELRAPFNIELLELHYDEVDGEELVNRVYYDGEEIDNWGGSTDGKSSDMIMVRMTDDEGSWERYEPEEKDWGHPESGPSPDDWEKSPNFKYQEHRPVYTGWYKCNYGWGSTYGELYWNGEAFGDWEHGRFRPKDDDGIVRWQGYNWNTADWANRPSEPPEARCKACGWVGTRDQMTMDDKNYDYECGACKSTKLDWIEYDPETAKGRKNRAKYCMPTMPVATEAEMEQGLRELKEEFERLMAEEENA